MIKGWLFRFTSWVVVSALSLILAACGGGNGESVVDSAATATDSLTVHASASGEVTPGLMVTLSAEVEDGGTDVGVITRRDILRTVIEGTEVS